MYIIPDKYMDNKTCADCFKYLTVGPVKKYPGGEIKCGRCTKPDDAGRVQQLVFPETAMFKCVNRFDGCRKVLLYGQVAEHETTCRGTTLACVCCEDAMLFPLYAIPRHFDARHEQLVLKKSTFGVKVTVPSRRVFLYALNDNLFFVECIVHPTLAVELKTFFLGRPAARPLCTYTVHFGDSTCALETLPKPCLPSNKPRSNGFIFSVPVFTAQYAFVQVHLDLRGSEVQLAKHVLISPKAKVRLPRRLRLCDPNCSRLSVSHLLTSLIVDDVKRPVSCDDGEYPPVENFSEFLMYCFNCWTTTHPNPSLFIETGALTYHIICDSCCEHLQKQSPDIAMLMGCEVFPELRTANFEYSCVWQMWGCSRYFSHHDRDDHETECLLQPPRRCPVAGCAFRGRLFEIGSHFKIDHPSRMVVLQRAPLMFDRSPNLNRNHFYMWAHYDFVWIEVAPSGGDQFQIRLPRRKRLETYGQPQPRVTVTHRFMEETNLLFDETPIVIRNGTVVQVWGYFPEDD